MPVDTNAAPAGGGAHPDGLAEALGQGVDPGSEIIASGPPELGGIFRLPVAAWAWALFQGVRDPYVVVVSIYIFAPYFATTVVGDPVRGQQLVANISTIQGLILSLTAPLLGAAVNRMGPRKPGLAVAVGLMIPMIAALWFVHPGPGGLSVPVTSLILGAIAVLLVYTDLLHNALLSTVATPQQAPVTSGLAYSLLNAISTAILVAVLWAFVLPGKVSWPIIPSAPLFGLNVAEHEPERIVGPIIAALFALGSVPLFLFAPDAARTGVRLRDALVEGAKELLATLKLLRGERNMTLFLASRMVYTDGKTALLAFSGLYAKGVMGWHVLEMLAFGILLSIFAVIGGFVGAGLDLLLGPRRAVIVEVAGSLFCVVMATGMNPHAIFYVIPWDSAAHPALWNGPMFRTLPEVLYLCVGFGTAIFVTAAYSSSRMLLVRLSPPDKLGSFFGLYALSGTATMWLGSLMVGIFTALWHTQQSGFAAIAGLLTLGGLGMTLVRGGDPLPRTGR
jgi:UMF1 family MFS transporter